VTSPQDPFATPPPGGQPPSEPYRAPDPATTPYGTSDGGAPGHDVPPGPGYAAPTYGSDQPGQQPYGQQQYGQPYQQPQYGQPYQQQQYGSVQRGPARNGLGIAALVLGILGLLTSWLVIGAVPGLIAIVLGAIGLGRVKRGEANNRGMAITGIVLGVLSLIVAAVVIAVGASFINSETGRNLTECIENAGNDQAARDACAAEFAEDVSG
jgi:hypothetical protein